MINAAAKGGAVSRQKHGSWVAPAGVAVGAAALAVSFALRDPFNPGAWPSCPFHAATGLWCPLCGSSRALYALCRGHVALMATNNPLLPLWLLLAGWGWLWWLSELSLIPARIPAPTSTRWLRLGLVAAVVGFWVARNLPGLSGLAPHGHP